MLVLLFVIFRSGFSMTITLVTATFFVILILLTLVILTGIINASAKMELLFERIVEKGNVHYQLIAERETISRFEI